jgi:hypothetical protein
MRSILFLALLASPALADNPKSPAPVPVPARAMKTDDCAMARKAGKTCEITIGNENITSDRPKNDGILVGGLLFSKLDSLLPIRRDFIREIVKSADDIE